MFYDFLTLVTCLLSVPIVQVFGIYLREQPALNHGSKFLRVFLFGGARHLAFTLVSWVHISCFVALPDPPLFSFYG